MADGMSVSEAAAWIGVPPDTLSRVLDGREGISPKLASRLEAQAGPGGNFGCACKPPTTKHKRDSGTITGSCPRHHSVRPKPRRPQSNPRQSFEEDGCARAAELAKKCRVVDYPLRLLGLSGFRSFLNGSRCAPAAARTDR